MPKWFKKIIHNRKINHFNGLHKNGVPRVFPQVIPVKQNVVKIPRLFDTPPQIPVVLLPRFLRRRPQIDSQKPHPSLP
jgi:hypothetical protein